MVTTKEGTAPREAEQPIPGASNVARARPSAFQEPASHVALGSHVVAGRSSLLRSNRPPANNYSRYVIRWLVAVVVAIFITGLVQTVATRALEPEGVGYLLYLLHDNLWLPFVGYSWTAAFPFSLLWWLTVLVMSILAIFGALTGWSALRALQRKVIYRLACFPAGTSLLDAGHSATYPGFFRFKFIEEAVRGQRAAAISVLKEARLTDERPGQDALSRAACASALYARISQRIARHDEALAKALLSSYEDLIVLQESGANDSVTRRLAKNVTSLALALIGNNPVEATDEPSHENCFQLECVAENILRVLKFYDPETPEPQRRALCGDLAAAIEVRREMLASQAYVLESAHIGRRVTKTNLSVRVDISDVTLAIALLLSTEVARRNAEPLLALALYDEFERLLFLHDFARSRMSGASAAQALAGSCVLAARLADHAYHLNRLESDLRPLVSTKRERERGLTATLFEAGEWNEVVLRDRGLSSAAAADPLEAEK